MNLKRLQILVLSGLIAALLSPQVLACRCGQRPLEAYFRQAHWVGRVAVARVHDPQKVDGWQARAADILVLTTYKGTGGLERIHTADSPAACGMLLLPGSEYWVFAHNPTVGTDTWWVDTCSGTRPVTADYMEVKSGLVAAALDSLARNAAEGSDSNQHLGRRITIATLDAAVVSDDLVAAFAARGVVSPNGAWRLVALEPPANTRPPRVTRIIVEREQATLLELALLGASGIERVAWVNEKLVLVSVVWRAGQQTTLLVDVELGRILYGAP